MSDSKAEKAKTGSTRKPAKRTIKKKTASKRETEIKRPAKNSSSSAKKAPAKKAPAKKAPAKSGAPARASASAPRRTKSRSAAGSVRRQSGGTVPVTDEQRRAMIAEAAYYKAMARGFAEGDIGRDWTEAEAEIDAMILRSTNASE